MKKIFVLLLILIVHNIYAQENSRIIPINFSYFGETIIRPGFEIGYEHAFYKGFNFTASIGGYVHQRNHIGLFINGGVNWRHTFYSGYSPEIGIGVGYLHTWAHGGNTYLVDDDGNVSIKRSGRPHFMPSIKFGVFGWDLRRKTNTPMRINLDAVLFGQYPYNNYIMPHVALKIGFTYYFKLNNNKKKGEVK